MKPTVLAAACGLAVAATASAQTSEWAAPVTGNWGLLANWDNMNVPDTATESALIDVAGTYNVILASVTPSIDNLTISNADATLTINAGRLMTINGDMANSGLVEINPTAIAATTTFRFGSGSVLSGSGVLRLSGSSSLAQISSTSGATAFTHAAGHEIRGFGRINSPMTNEGLIAADVPGGALDVRSAAKSNTGVIKAEGGGLLTTTSVSIDQTGGGQLTADTAGTLTLTSSNITAGTINQVGDGVVTIAGAGTYQSVTTSGDVVVSSGASMRVDTSLTNNGTLAVNPTNIGITTSIRIENDVLFTGTGDMRLSGASSRAQISSALAELVATNDTAHTIQGFGRITSALVNNGLVEADVGSTTLELPTNDKVNNATMRARDAATMLLNAIEVDQSGGGTLEAIANGTITIQNSDVIGGDLLRGGSGLIRTTGVSMLDGVTVTGGLEVTAGSTTAVVSGILNNGTIDVNPTNIGLTTSVRFDTSGAFSGIGEVVLGGSTSRAQITSTNDTITVTNGPNHEIRGFGRITAPLINNGTVSADFASGTLELSTEDKVNNALMRATGEGRLFATNIAIDQTGGGTLAALDTATIDLTSVDIIGGDLVRGPGAALNNSGFSSFQAVTVTGGMTAVGGSNAAIIDGIVNNGTIEVNPTNLGISTSITFVNDGTLDGTGEVVLGGSSVRAFINSTDNTRVMTQAAAHTIRGFGQIQTDMVNEGTVLADVTGQTLSLRTAGKRNNATMRAENGGVLEIFSILIDQTGGGTTTADAANVSISSADILGGVIDSANGGTVTLTGTTSLESVTMDADATLNGGSTVDILTGMTNDGTLTVNPTNAGIATTARIQDGITISGSGSILLGGTTVRAQIVSDVVDGTFTNGQGHTIGGIGQVQMPFTNNGIIAPGLSTGEIDLNGSVTSGSTAQIQIELAGDSDTDFIDAGGAVVLGGNIDVRLIDGYVPAGRTVYTVMQADGGITGEFTSITGDDVGNGLVLKWATDGNELQVAYTCPSDVGFPLGTADIDDVLAFLDAFANQGAIADLAPPQGVFNIDDVLFFLDAFAQGCP